MTGSSRIPVRADMVAAYQFVWFASTDDAFIVRRNASS